jgi:hypothetical protein
MSAGFGFSFGGVTLYRPGILATSSFGTQRILQLLPTSTICMIGAADGGQGGGTVYQFSDTGIMQQVLRSGPLPQALLDACNIGGVSGIVAVVVGTKSSASLSLNSGAAILSAGDQGAYTNAFTVTIATGTSGKAVTFTYTDPSGATNTYGGIGTAFDNLTNYSDLQAAMLADPLITPGPSTGYAPLFALNVVTDGAIANLSTANLAGGTGTSGYVNTTVAASPAPSATGCSLVNAANVSVGSVLIINAVKSTVLTITGNAITFATRAVPVAGNTVTSLAASDYTAGVDALATTAYDVGHAVQCYTPSVWSYWDAAVTQQAPYCRWHRLIHQVFVSGLSQADTKVQNSEALANAGVTAATGLNSIRSSVCVQQLLIQDPATGGSRLQDGAVMAIGDAALQGATGQWGPATPLTADPIATALNCPYEVLDTTGDINRCEINGVFLFENFGQPGSPGSVRIIHSLTTSPSAPSGVPWLFREFSVVRVSDALLANVKAQVETSTPKTIGAGNTVKTMASVVADVVDVLELGLDAGWITQYDPASIIIAPTGNLGTDDIVKYSASPTVPLNHLGIAQNLLPYSVTVSTSGVVNG